MKLEARYKVVEYIQSIADMKSVEGSLLDYHVDVKTGMWTPWQQLVPTLEIEPKDVSSDIIVPTVDTVRHVDVLRM